MAIKIVTVIGATGTMGANAVGIFASFGDAKVYAVGRNIDKVKASIPRIINSVRADSIKANIIPADFSMLDECIANSDLIFESVTEDIEIKKEMARTVGYIMRMDAVSCTGSSGLSVTDIAECYPEDLRGRFFGVHMFNPPYSMTLCELTNTKYSDDAVTNQLEEYLQNKLLRTVVKVKDSPAFLGNRIGFHFINKALQYAERYKLQGGVDYIDAVLGPYTGRMMAPLATADFVGLDVNKAIVNNIYEHTDDYSHETFVLPEYIDRLVSDNKLGRKTKEGLYKVVKNEDGSKTRLVYDINKSSYRKLNHYRFEFAENMKEYISIGEYDEAFKKLLLDKSQEANICKEFLLEYIVYSLFIAKEVAYSVDSADDVMATGFNWCPPLALLEGLSRVADVKQLIETIIPTVADVINIEELLNTAKPSKYDYRRYIRSGR